MAGRLAGKVALVTGAGGAIGGAIASQFAAEGAAVVVHDIRADAVAARVQAITDTGARAFGHACEVADSAAVETMFDAAADAVGVVDVLVNCAGTSGTGDPRDESAGPLGLFDDDWRRLLAIHLDGSFFCTRAMVRRLLPAPRPASVVCISSIAGLSGWGDLHYSTAKGGLLGFVRALARRGGPMGLRANAVCPGVIDDGMTNAVPREALEGLRMMTPLGTFGTPDDIAAACVYLAGDESRFVTGQWLSPNGGLVIG